MAVAGAAEPALVLDAAPAATQKPYSPADGQVVEITPPPFLWVPVKHQGTYLLQVSTCKEFSEGSTQTFANLRRSVFVPREPLPEKLEFSQTDRYEPEPESVAGRWENTWHLTAGTISPAESGHFLAVLLPYRKSASETLPRVELVQGTGAVGVRLTAPDGALDLVAFRTDGHPATVVCDGVEIAGQVFARGKDKEGRLVRQFTRPRE